MNYALEYLELADELLSEYTYPNAVYNKIVKDGIYGEITATKEYLIKIVILPSAKYSKETLKFKDGVADSDYLAYMYPISGVDVALEDTITDKTSGKIYTIKSAVALHPNGTNIIYKLELK